MATADKKKKEAPTFRFQDSFDAKVTSHGGPFAMWALRNGEGKPTTSTVLMRKGDPVEKGFPVTRDEIPALRALLAHFEENMLPQLDKYGMTDTESDD